MWIVSDWVSRFIPRTCVSNCNCKHCFRQISCKRGRVCSPLIHWQVNRFHQRRNFEEDSYDIVMCSGGCEIIHIGAPAHKGARSRVRVVMNRGQRADGSRKEKGAAGKPKRQSGEPVSNNFILSMIRNLTVWYDAVPQESGQVSVCWF